MPLQLPVLDDRNFEQLLDEAKRRIPVYTPEWTNFDVDSDPGITIVELFAFLTDTLLYRANRVPELNRLKFLQLLGIPLQPAAAAQGIITIRNDRGPLEALPLDAGVVVAAGNVRYLTRDAVSVLPVEAQVFYKTKLDNTDPRYQSLAVKYEALRLAAAAADDATETSSAPPDLVFYESTRMPPPTPAAPNPVVDLLKTTPDRALYLALLAPQNVPPEDARAAIADKVLSLGIVPALDDSVPPLLPLGQAARRRVPSLIYEIPAVTPDADRASYTRLTPLQAPDVLSETGIVQLQLPAIDQIQTWDFADPLKEGLDGFPPKIDDDKVRNRVVTWVRVRLPSPTEQPSQPDAQKARLTWVGINATRVTQAVAVLEEPLGIGSGEPDQVFVLANTPVLPNSIRLEVEDANGLFQPWRLTDDLLAAGPDDPVFSLDPEAGQVRCGDGLRAQRPPAGRRLRASYQYGGGVQGNVAIGVIKTSPDPRLQGGFKIENPVATWGGDSGQTVAEGEKNIPLYLKHRDRLVTDQDFHDVTMQTSGVDMGRVEVLSLFKPGTTTPAPGVVTVMVIPRFDALRPLWPTPDRNFLQAVCDYLDPRRLVTTELYVRGPVYKSVYVTVGIKVQAGFFPDIVRRNVTDRLNLYLAALPPGGPALQGWPVDKRLVKKDLEAVVTRVAGVEYVEDLFLGVEDGTDRDFYQFNKLELPLLAGLSVVEGAPEPLASVLVGGSAQDPTTPTLPVPVSRAKC